MRFAAGPFPINSTAKGMGDSRHKVARLLGSDKILGQEGPDSANDAEHRGNNNQKVAEYALTNTDLMSKKFQVKCDRKSVFCDSR